LLNATNKLREGISLVMWIGRVGNAIGVPCGARAPVAGSMRSALTWCLSPTTPPMPDALLLDAT
jgi:hypothetical protein